MYAADRACINARAQANATVASQIRHHRFYFNGVVKWRLDGHYRESSGTGTEGIQIISSVWFGLWIVEQSDTRHGRCDSVHQFQPLAA